MTTFDNLIKLKEVKSECGGSDSDGRLWLRFTSDGKDMILFIHNDTTELLPRKEALDKFKDARLTTLFVLSHLSRMIQNDNDSDTEDAP